MEFSLSCEIFCRIARVGASLPQQDLRHHLRSVFVERKAGKLFVISTNARFAAIECVHNSPGLDGNALISIVPELIEQCKVEISFDSKIFVVHNPALQFTSLKTSFGWQFPGNAMVKFGANNQFPTWREWLPKSLPTKSVGAMFANVDMLTALASASPSGRIVWPDYIDNTKPTIVRDTLAENWLGVFMPHMPLMENLTATIPEWVKE